ncbi:MAG TPA: hypothetical protein GX717_02980 [Clostridiaceae bacterium]|nr:hypothetical protein [Clostridiaceae bacterium]
MNTSDCKGLMKPWTPMESTEKDGKCSVSMWGRTYEVNNSVLFTSITTQNQQMLSAPIRIVGRENGHPIEWNENETFIMDKSDERVILCATQQSESFIVNTSLSLEYDGCCIIDLKLMPRGRTVQEVFGLAKTKPNPFELEQLWVEIPIKKRYASYFHYWPSYGNTIFEGENIPNSPVSQSRRIPSSMALEFKPLVWLGTEEVGLSWFAESDENWQPADKNRAIEIIVAPDEVVLRLRLIEDRVNGWEEEKGVSKEYAYKPISFQFGLQATPVKPFPKNPYKEKNLHIDCFIKVLEDYYDFLSKPVVSGSDEIGFDRIKRLGVTTLYLHEKWNKIQNYWEIPCDTQWRIKKIIDECHKRDIKVIPYFGYELSTLSPSFYSKQKECLRDRLNHSTLGSGWYRKPNQRAYIVCYNSSWQDEMVSGIKKMMETYKFDGIYLDTTLRPAPCANSMHGCGYSDPNGERRVTYPIFATRNLARRLYSVISSNGGIINSHNSNCLNVPAMSFFHLNLDGEGIQMYIRDNGIEAVPMDYLRTQYVGRNFGVPCEFLVYPYPNWSFKDSLCLSLIHGILPRPNDIGEPLEIMSEIWKVIDKFPISNSTWHPYWDNKNEVKASTDEIRISYYKHIPPSGASEFLVFASNVSSNELEKVELQFNTNFNQIKITDTQNEVEWMGKSSFQMSFECKSVKILYVTEVE